jgi:inorganic pyrophosphatase
VKITGWAGPEEAAAEILSGVQRYNSPSKKPMF